MAANHRQSITLNVGIGQVMTVLRDRAFCSALNLDLKSENPTAHGVWFRFHHGVTFTSWGEKITVTLTSVGADTTIVEAFSECGMPTQVIDWGKNKQNVCNILEYIEAKAPFAAPQPQYARNVAQGGQKYCVQCGKQIPKDAMFCSRCGKKQPDIKI